MSIARNRLEARRDEIKTSLENLKQQFTAGVAVLSEIENWLAEDLKEIKTSENPEKGKE